MSTGLCVSDLVIKCRSLSDYFSDRLNGTVRLLEIKSELSLEFILVFLSSHSIHNQVQHFLFQLML